MILIIAITAYILQFAEITYLLNARKVAEIREYENLGETNTFRNTSTASYSLARQLRLPVFRNVSNFKAILT